MGCTFSGDDPDMGYPEVWDGGQTPAELGLDGPARIGRFTAEGGTYTYDEPPPRRVGVVRVYEDEVDRRMREMKADMERSSLRPSILDLTRPWRDALDGDVDCLK